MVLNQWFKRMARVCAAVSGGLFGVGASVTQITSRTTAVVINSLSGSITLVSAAGSTTAASFTVTNDKVSAGDVVVVSQASGTDKYDIGVSAVAAGSFQITSRTYSGTTTETPVFNFVVLKANTTAALDQVA